MTYKKSKVVMNLLKVVGYVAIALIALLAGG
jgi:hypothetical protein